MSAEPTSTPNYNLNSDKDSITWLELSPDLRDENIVQTLMVKVNSNKKGGGGLINLQFNDSYKKKTIISDIHRDSWIKTITNFSDMAKKKGVKPKHIEILTDTLDDNHERIIGLGIGQGNNNSDGKKQEEEKPSTYKYSKLGRGFLHESVILGGIPTFIKYENSKIESVLEICEPSRILRAPYPEEYPYRPYEFASIEELEEYTRRAKESPYSRYIRRLSLLLRNTLTRMNTNKL